MARKRNQIVALYLKPEDAYCVLELINVKSAILAERLRNFARIGDADCVEDFTITMTELDQCCKLSVRLHDEINLSLHREANGEEQEYEWEQEFYDERN